MFGPCGSASGGLPLIRFDSGNRALGPVPKLEDAGLELFQRFVRGLPVSARARFVEPRRGGDDFVRGDGLSRALHLPGIRAE